MPYLRLCIDGDCHAVEARPSNEMLSDIAALPRGATVGVDRIDPREVRKLEVVVGGQRYVPHQPWNSYWRSVITHCKLSGHTVVHVGDPVLFQFCKQLQCIMAFSAAYKRPDKHYFHSTVHDYAVNVTMAQQLAGRLLESRLDAVVLSRPQADLVASALGWGYAAERHDKGYLFESIAIDEEDKRNGIMPDDWDYVPEILKEVENNKYERSPCPNAAKAQRKCVERRMSALLCGRVTDKKPDFIGTWDIDVPPKGLFEVFVDNVIVDKTSGNKLTGRFEDTGGSGSFKGTITGDDVSFDICYDLELSCVCHEHEHYAGSVIGNKIVGTFTQESLPGEGRFVMVPFRKGITLADLLVQDAGHGR
jgi:hypothetical protein